MHRFLEEALELAQSFGCSNKEAHELVDYVFSRDVGQPEQEVGGVMVTLAALCSNAEIDMNGAGNQELVAQLVADRRHCRKQASKPLKFPFRSDG